jgi:YD repeat-containing protein
MKKYICFVVIILCIISNNWAQNENKIWYNSVSIPPSPNASSLGKYSEYPVDKSTGALSLSIPLLLLKEDDIEIPISLSYHGSGIKVQEESSNVGLGWSLNCGGVITRVMNGKPDEVGFIRDGRNLPKAQIIDHNFNIEFLKENTYTWLLNLYNNNTLEDFEPDMFSYNVNGISGTFYFGNDGLIKNIPENDYVIKPIFNPPYGMVGFIIDDEKGNSYYFGNVFNSGYTENTTAEHEGGGTTSFTSSFYLAKITNALKGTNIDFYYNSINGFENSQSYSSSMIYKQLFSGSFVLESSNESTNSTVSNYKTISKIKTNNNEVNFFSSISEEELPKIDSIVFENQKFSFVYSFFNNEIPRTRTNTRLKLSKITESSKINQDIKTYELLYSDIQLPDKNSNSIDFWGYYNNKNNLSLTPKLKVGNQILGDANREVDTNYTQAGVLEKIVYPTKGYSEFRYENNKYNDKTSIDDIKVSGPEHTITSNGNPNTWEHCKIDTIVFEPGYIYFNAKLSGKVNITNMNMFDPDENFGTVSFLDYNTGIEYDTKDIYYQHDWIEQVFAGVNFTSVDKLVIKICGQGRITIPTAKIWFDKYNPAELNQPKSVLGGGLRIKEIKSYNNNSDLLNTKIYDYNESGYQTMSKAPFYSEMIVREYSVPINANASIIVRENKLHLFSTPPGGLGFSGNSVAYEKTSEYTVNGVQSNGKIVTQYLKKHDPCTAGSASIPKPSFSYARSLITKEEIFSADNQLDPLKVTENTYIQDTSRGYTIQGFKCNRKIISNVQPNPCKGTDWFYTNYIIESYPYLLSKVFTNERTDNGMINKEERYFYESKNHMSITKKVVIDGSDQYTTQYFYPGDFSGCSENCKNQYNSDLYYCLHSPSINTYYQQSVTLNAILCTALINCYNCEIVCSKNHPNNDFELSKCYKNCRTDLTNELSNNGYYTGLAQLNNPYFSCVDAANSSYMDCITQYNDCKINEFINAENENKKAIALLNILDQKKKIVEEKTFKNGIMIDHWKYFMGIENRMPGASIFPLLKSAELYDQNNNLIQTIYYHKYDTCGNILEMQAGNSNPFDSYIYGYKNNYPIAEAKNATINECGYTGFENNESNSFSTPGAPSTEYIQDHFTGEKALKVSSLYGPGNSFEVGTNAANHSGYKASVWVKGGTDAYLHIQVNEDWSLSKRVKNPNNPAGSWNLMEVDLPYALYQNSISPTMKIKVYCGNESGGTAIFDDLRFYPMDAQMTTYTYKPLVGMTTSSDVNNKPTTYEYDAFGRLVLVRDFEGNILKKNEYRYKQP